MMKNYNVRINDVVQIFPSDGRIVGGWFGVVNKVTTDGIEVGVQTYCDGKQETITISLDWTEFVIIGKSVWKPTKIESL